MSSIDPSLAEDMSKLTGGDPREQKPSYDIERIDFKFVEETTDKKELKAAYECIKTDGGFWELEKALE